MEDRKHPDINILSSPEKAERNNESIHSSLNSSHNKIADKKPCKEAAEHVLAVKEGWDRHLSGYTNPIHAVARWGGLEELRKVIAAVEHHLEINSKSSGVLLDAGCGSGAFLFELKRRNPLIQYYGCDISFEMVKMANSILPNSALCTSDIAYLPFRNSSFDYIVCYSVLHYLPSIDYVEKAVYDFSRLLRDRGKLFLGDVLSRKNMYRCDFFIPEKRKALEEEGYVYDDTPVFCPVKWLWFDEDEIVKILEKNHFRAVIIPQCENSQWGCPAEEDRFDILALKS